MSEQFGKGRYLVKAIGQGFGASKNKGTPEFTLRVVVLAQVFDNGEMENVNQAERTIYSYITEKTAERLCEDLQRIGYDKDSFKYLNPANENFHDFNGVEFEAYCNIEQYNGQDKEKWGFAFPRDQAPKQPLEDKQVRELDALFGKHLKKKAEPNNKSHIIPGTNTAKMQDANRQMQEAAGGEDIPF